MAEPKVSLLLQLVDKLTAPAEGAKTALGKLEGALNSFGVKAAALATSVALGAFFKSAVEEAMQAEAALARLGHSVRNAGEDFDKWKPQIDETITRLTKLTTYTDDDLVVALDTLVMKTGDVQGSLKNLGLVTDLAAAKHMDLGEAATAVAKAINGGDRLFKEFGVTVGTTQEKVEQLTAILAGRASTDAETFEGRVKNLSKAWGEFKEDAGRAIIENDAVGDSIRSVTAMLDAMAPRVAAIVASFVNNIVAFVGGIQVMAADTARFFMRLPVEFNLMIGYLVTGFGKLLEQAAKIPVIGGKFKDVAASVTASGKQMVDRQTQALADIETGYRESIADIVGTVSAGEKKITGVVTGGQSERGAAAKEAHKQSEAQAKATADRLTKISEDAGRELLASVSTSYRAMAAQVGTSSLVMQEAMLDYADVLDKEVEGKLFEAGQAAEKTDGKVKDLGASIQDGAEYFLQFADSIGGVSKGLTTAIGLVGSLGGSLSKILSGDVAGGIAGAVVSLGGIIGSLFGTSPAERARRALLQKNSDRLKELSTEVHALNLSTPGGTLQAVGNLSKEGLEKSAGFGFGIGFGSRVGTAQLGTYLRQQGIGMEAFKVLAKDLGIDLMEKDGTVDTKAVTGIFGVAKKEALASPFDATFAGRQEASAAERGARGTDTAANQRSDLLKNLTGSGAGTFSDYLNSFDLSTPEGRAAARAAIGDLIGQASSGQLSSAFFGDMSKSDGIGVLNDFVGLIDAYDSAGTGAGIGAAPTSASAGVAPAPAETIGAATSGSSGVAVSSSEGLAFLSTIAGNTRETADNTLGILSVIEGPLLTATQAIATGLGGDALAIRVDELLRSQRDLTAVGVGD